jgi:hypothetical protein
MGTANSMAYILRIWSGGRAYFGIWNMNDVYVSAWLETLRMSMIGADHISLSR